MKNPTRGIIFIIFGILSLLAVVVFFVWGLILGPVLITVGVIDLIRWKFGRVSNSTICGIIILPILFLINVVLERLNYILYYQRDLEIARGGPYAVPPIVNLTMFEKFQFQVWPILFVVLVILDIFFIIYSIRRQKRALAIS